MNGIICSYASNQYAYYEKGSPSLYTRKTITGAIVGCSKCVGYCEYKGHPGFLTKKTRQQHDCINKKCMHYISKPKRKFDALNDQLSDERDYVINLVRDMTKSFEGMKVVYADCSDDGQWALRYITISNEYPLHDVSMSLMSEYGICTTWKKLNYSFDNCVNLILSK